MDGAPKAITLQNTISGGDAARRHRDVAASIE